MSPKFPWGEMFPDPIGDQLRRQLNSIFESQRAAIQKVMAPLQELRPISIRPEIIAAFKEIAEHYTRNRPRNWPEDANMHEIIDLIERTGWCLIWLPGPDVILDLLGSPDDALGDVLLTHETEIVEDAFSLLTEVDRSRERIDWLASCCSEAIEVHQANHVKASVALSAAMLTALVHVDLERPNLSEARKEWLNSWEDATLPQLRWALIRLAIAHALSRYSVGQGDPVPTRFSRHGIAHNLTADQATQLNSLAGIMLFTAAVRELAEQD